MQNLLLVLILACFAITSCTRSTSRITLGKSTFEDLKKSEGNPVRVDTLQSRPQAQAAHYDDGIFYQLEKDFVVAKIRKPNAYEVTLQYWRHSWVDYETNYKEIPGSERDHTLKIYQFSALDLSSLVIYDAAADHILYVVDYAPR